MSTQEEVSTCQLFLFWRNSSSFRSKKENDFIMCSCFCSNLCIVMYRKFRNVPLFKFFSLICSSFWNLKVGKYVFVFFVLFCFLRGEWGSVYLNSWNIVYSCLYLEENLFFPGFSTIKKSPMYLNSLCLLSRVIVCRDQRCRHLGVKLYHAGSVSDSTAPKYTNLTIHAIVSCVYQQHISWSAVIIL